MTLKESIAAEAGQNTHKRTGFILDACLDDAKMFQGLWQPEDTLPAVSRYFAKSHPKLANFLIKIYLAFNGKKEVPK